MKRSAIVFFLLFFFIIFPAFAGAKSSNSVKKYAKRGQGVRISQGRKASSVAENGEAIIGDLLTSLDPLAIKEKGG